jgi:hypothetical protein
MASKSALVYCIYGAYGCSSFSTPQAPVMHAPMQLSDISVHALLLQHCTGQHNSRMHMDQKQHGKHAGMHAHMHARPAGVLVYGLRLVVLMVFIIFRIASM